MLLLFDSFRMEFKEPFLVSNYPIILGLFGLHMELQYCLIPSHCSCCLKSKPLPLLFEVQATALAV